MTISNQAHIEYLHKIRIILTISLLTLSVVLFSGFVIQNTFLYLSRFVWGSIPLVLYITYLFVIHHLDINFIFMEITREKIIFKFQSLTPFRRSKNARYEIPLKQFAKYTLSYHFLNMVPRITFFQKIQGKLAKYPPVSLSGMKKEQREELYAALNIVLSKQ
jgi:hypothetical protein